MSVASDQQTLVLTLFHHHLQAQSQLLASQYMNSPLSMDLISGQGPIFDNLLLWQLLLLLLLKGSSMRGLYQQHCMML